MPGEAEEAVIEQRAVALGADAFAEVDYAVGADANEVLTRRLRDAAPIRARRRRHVLTLNQARGRGRFLSMHRAGQTSTPGVSAEPAGELLLVARSQQCAPDLCQSARPNA